MTNLDHSEELRAELNHGILTRRERAQVERELKAALAHQALIEGSRPEMLDEAPPT